jgi:hypothetical protein
LGYGKVNPDGSKSIRYGTIKDLSEVIHFSSYESAVEHAALAGPVNMNYLMISAYGLNPLPPLVFEVWYKLPTTDHDMLRTYHLTDNDELAQLLSDTPAKQFPSKEQAEQYAIKVALKGYTVVEVSDEF